MALDKKKYHYEFGIFSAKRKPDDQPYSDADYLESRIVIDLREVKSFYKIPETVAPNGMVFKNIVSVSCGDSEGDTLLYYPYKLFRQLYIDVMEIGEIVTLPYPS